MPPHSLPLTLIGAACCGWAGSASTRQRADGVAANAFVTTNTRGRGGDPGWIFIEWMTRSK